MAKANASKPQEHFDIADNDRISKFPDSILCHILSFLPTKYSVQTSILSRRWRFTWTSVSVLDLDDNLFKSNHLPKRRRISASTKSFKNFVNMVLILRSHPCVQRFRLKLTNSYPTSVVNSWIWAAITHNAEELDLSMEDMIKLPRTLFNCGTIVVLKLASDIDLDVPESVSLPTLKVVHLKYLWSLCDASIKKILSGSPILEELVIERDHQDGVKIYSILSSSLKTLVIRHSRVYGIDNHYEVVIDAPKLEYLELYDGTSQVVVDGIEFKNASSILKSTFDFPYLSCDNVPQLWKTPCSMYGLRNVKVLSFPLFMFKLSYSDTCFDNLTQLMVKYCGKDLSRLPKILSTVPNLEVLVLNKTSYCNHTITCKGWKQEKFEIRCLKISLKRLQLGKFDAEEGELQMLEYFLENARVLNEIRLVSRYGDPKGSVFLNKLLTNPRCSNALKIIFT